MEEKEIPVIVDILAIGFIFGTIATIIYYLYDCAARSLKYFAAYSKRSEESSKNAFSANNLQDADMTCHVKRRKVMKHGTIMSQSVEYEHEAEQHRQKERSVTGRNRVETEAGGSYFDLKHKLEKRQTSYPKFWTPESKNATFECVEYATRHYSNTIVIAADATPSRVGDLLVLPYVNKIFFYSIDWTDTFRFPDPDPDKFELLNSFLALEVFTDFVSVLRESNLASNVILKVDNTFSINPSGVYSKSNNIHFRKLFDLVDNKLKSEPFVGSWEYALKKSDKYIRLADKLSKKDANSWDSLPDVEFKYSQCNISNDTETRMALQNVCDTVERLAREIKSLELFSLLRGKDP